MEKVYLKYNDETQYKQQIECDFGPAWEMIISGPFYALKKHDIKYFSLILIIEIVLCTLCILILKSIVAVLLCIPIVLFVNFIFSLNYNTIIITNLLKLGYIPMNTDSANKLITKGLYFKLQ